MSSICSDIFNINKCKLKNKERHNSYNYIYTVIVIIRINQSSSYIIITVEFPITNICSFHVWPNMNYIVLIHDNIKTSITLLYYVFVYRVRL